MKAAFRPNLTRALREWTSGKRELTPAQRIDELFLWHRLRNFIFGLNVPMLDGFGIAGTSRFQGVTVNVTPPFANDLIITDVVLSDAIMMAGQTCNLGLQLNILGVPGLYSVDFWGAGQFMPPYFLADTNPQAAGAVNVTDTDASIKAGLGMVPRLLRKGQQLQARWAQDDCVNGMAQNIQPMIVFSTCYALCENQPYACPSPLVLDLCREYVKVQERETTILDLTIETANFPALGAERFYSVEGQARPLLILGMASNLQGCQIKIRDESKQFDITAMFQSPANMLIENDGSQFAGANYVQATYLPIWGIAPSNLVQNGSTIKWLPVPHFLEPNARLGVTLRAGLRDNGQPMSVAGTTARGHIAFICVTL